MSDLQVLSNEIYGLRDTFEQVATDRNVHFEREAQFACQLFAANPYLLKVAMQNRGSVMAAVTNVAAIGITLNPALKLAYLVPRSGKVCLDISYMGLMHLAMLSGSIKWVKAEVVRAKDQFTIPALGEAPQHVFSPFGDRGEIVGAYVIVKTDDGEYLTHTMPIEDIYAIRDRSEAWKKDQGGPWKTDPGEMIKKTVVKQAYKYWPKVSNQLKEAIHHLNTEAGEGIAQENPGMPQSELDQWIVNGRNCRDKLELGQLWKKAVAACRAYPKDLASYNKIKAEYAEIGTQLPQAPVSTLEATDVDSRPVETIIPDALKDLIADLEATADGGIEDFVATWEGLSKTSKGKIEAIPGLYNQLRERAEKAGGAAQ